MNPVRLSGFLTGSYFHASQPSDGIIVGRLFDRNDNSFIGNAARITIKKAVATGRLDFGFQVDALYGKNATLTQSAGLNIADQVDVTQAFAALNIPTSRGNFLQIKVGKMGPLQELEVLDDVLNPNFSHGYQFIYTADISELGIGIDARLSPLLLAQFRITNGWDVVRDNNSGKTANVRLEITLSDAVDLAISGYSGAEKPGNSADHRYGAEVTGAFKPATNTTLFAQLDMGGEHGLGINGGSAQWFGAGGWAVHDLSPKASVVLRGEFFRDRDGTRTSGTLGFAAVPRRDLTSGTVTLNYKPVDHVLLRPELRLEHSSRNDFGDPAAPKATQLTFGLGLSLLF